ncbi:MAG: hypothetical protein HPY81_03620 [Firmicutes bacterium]|nr:hypothetical protein [Bacillota bacterium]
MIKVKVTYASVFNRPQEEIELTTSRFIELKEKVVQKLGVKAIYFATGGNLILESEVTFYDNQEIFVFPMLAGG